MFNETEKIVVRCLIAMGLAFGVEWIFIDYWQLVVDVVLIAGFIACQLMQHDWKFSSMGGQDWGEWVLPTVIILIIYAL